MRVLILSLTMIVANISLAYADEAPTCSVYKNGTYLDDANVLPSTPVSQDMLTAMNVYSPVDSNSNKYQVESEGLSIELTKSTGCAAECWNVRHIMVTIKGVSAFTSAEASTMRFGSSHPTMTMLSDKDKLLIICSE